MTAFSVYVRARDGALYKNPVFIFPDGFICCPDRERLEISLWCSDEVALGAPPDVDVSETLARVFGIHSAGEQTCSAVLGSVCYKSRGMCVVPGTDPWEFRAAISYQFMIDKRTPKPTMHDGTERYASRIRGFVTIDHPAHRLDALQIDIPQPINTNQEKP